MHRRLFLLVAALLSASSASFAENLTVLSTSPVKNGLNAPVGGGITINFDRPVATASVTSASIRAFGRWSGAVQGRFSFSNGDQSVTLTPKMPLSAGENVMVVLSHDLMAVDGSPMRSAGYSFRFWTRSRPACLNFNQLDVMSNRTTPDQQTRIYGALGADLNKDGWLDIVTVNEVSADLRVFMNKADGTGLYHPWLQPPEPGLFEMSPNEPADFNNDGNSDVCVASTDTDHVLIFLGNGDGTFQPAQIILVGDHPLGIAVLDVDGDGDLDIVNGNLGSDNLSLLLNNGSGIFGAPSYFEGGVSGEYGVASADMNNDGILDLVVGGNSNQKVSVMKGNGNGTFSPMMLQNSGGPVWQIGTGDVNGDGWDDVHTCNSFNNSGSILFNNAGASLGLPQVYSVPGHAPATDLGDFDGDGDLDWLLSSFGGGVWRLFTNNGDGTFTQSRDFPAPANPSCGTVMDIDNDGDLDIVLTDEIADVVILMQNVVAPGDVNCDLIVNSADLLAVINSWGPCPGPPAACPTDIAPVGGDGTVNVSDLLTVINNWG